MVIIGANYAEHRAPIPHNKQQRHQPFSFGEHVLKYFFHRRACRTFWSRDSDTIDKHLFPRPIHVDSPHVIWFCLQ